MRNDRIFGDDDDAVADEIKFVVNIFTFSGGRNRDVVPDARVLVNDGVFNVAVRADADARLAFAFIFADGFIRFVKIAAEDDAGMRISLIQAAPGCRSNCGREEHAENLRERVQQDQQVDLRCLQEELALRLPLCV